MPVTGQSKRNFPQGRPVQQNFGPNPFLTGLSRFYQQNIAPVMNSPLIGFPNPMGLLNKRQVQNPNKLNKEQQMALAEGSLNRALAARMNKGGIVSKVKSVSYTHLTLPTKRIV